MPKQLQYDFERRSRARKSAEAVSSPQLLLPTGDGDDDDYEFDENEFDENEYEYEYEDSDGNTIAEIAVNFNKAPQSVSGDRVIINNSINIDSEITDAPVQGYQYKQTEEFTNNNIATRVIDVDDSEEDSILTNTFIRGNNAGNGNSDSYNDGGVVFEGIVRAQESTINNSFSTTTSATVSTTTNKIANKIKNSDDNDEEEKEVISTATIRNKVNIITSNDNNPNNQIIDSEGSITNSPSQQKSLAESALLAADLVFFLAEKIANAVGPVIAGTTGNILEQVANNLRIGEPTQSELVNGWLDEKDKENSDSCSGQSDISGSGSSTTDYSTATTTTSINSTKQTGIMTLINGGNESAPEVPKQRWKSVMRVESTKPNSKNK